MIEVVPLEELKYSLAFYDCNRSTKRGVHYGFDNYMLRVPSEKEMEGTTVITKGVANYLYSKLATLFELDVEYVRLVNYDNIFTSMSRDICLNSNSRFYSLNEILLLNEHEKDISLISIEEKIKEFDTKYFGQPVLLTRFQEIKILDFITLNWKREIKNIGVMVTSKSLMSLAPIIGGSDAFYSGYSKSSVREAVNVINRMENKYDRVEEYHKRLKRNAELYNYVLEGNIPKEVLAKFCCTCDKVDSIINEIDFLDNWFKDYITNIINLAVNMLKDTVELMQ